MNTIKTGFGWMDALMPEGLPIDSATLITGPGGSGKPLIGDTITSAWLRAGGSVIFMSLQYPSPDFVYTSIEKVANLNLDDYRDHIAFIALDASLEGMTPVEGRRFRANVVKPEIWDAALAHAAEMVEGGGPGILVFASAINLLLFSPTYGEAILAKIKETMTTRKPGWTYLFSASTTAKKEEIAELEAIADNLFFSWSEKEPFRLYMKIVRMKDVPFDGKEIQVPIPPNALSQVKEIAEHSRKRVIPQISQL